MIIRISTDNEVTVHEYPKGDDSEQMQYLKALIGEKCTTVEHVSPRRLYTVVGASDKPTKVRGNAASILVDEDGHFHNLPVNAIGSYLYETDLHGNPILGNLLVIGEFDNGDGIEFSNLSNSQFNIIFPEINQLAKKAREN